MIDWTKEDVTKAISDGRSAFIYFYTPLCGTCQVAGRMLGVAEELVPGLAIYKTDLNYMPDIAEQIKIESVPCLLVLQEGSVKEKLYAFRSVPYLLGEIGKNFP